MSKITGLDFSTIENPYNDNLNRIDTGTLSSVGTIDLGLAGDSDDYINRELSGEDFEDLWISSWIKSRNYKPKSQGFLLDGKKGYIECMKLYVGAGGIEGGSLHIPNETADDSFHTNYYGDSWWGCNVADLNIDVDNAKAYILKTGYAKFQNAAIEGTSTIDGRAATILSAAIDASGHFADNAIDTAAGTILSDFIFGASGAIQIGEYVNGASGDIKISPTGILGRDDSGATTFSINGTTGVAVLNGLVVGTNVGLGTAQDSAGVTTIIGNTVTTGYVNALNITAEYVTASISISSPTITGGTIRTASGNPRVQLSGANNRLEIYNTGGSNIGYFGNDGANGGFIYINQPDTNQDYPPVYITSVQDSNVINAYNTNSTISNRPAFRFESNNANSECMYVKNSANNIALFISANTTNHALSISQSGTGYLVGTNVGGCYCTKAGVWTDASSKTVKENFESITVLDKLKDLEILKYNYISERKLGKEIKTKIEKKKDDKRKGGGEVFIKRQKTNKHFTPMAEDFNKIFKLGNDDGISPADLAGIALQGVKELAKKIEILEKNS